MSAPLEISNTVFEATTAPREKPREDGPPLTVFEPLKGWRSLELKELWRFRELIYFLTWRDVKVRYKQTLLGASWALLQPAMMMVVFTIFFGRMAKVPSGDLPYPLFVYAGLLPWTFFATAVAGAGNSVVNSERLITKIYFPRLAIPLATVWAAVIDFCIAMALLVVLMIWYRVTPGWQLLLIPMVCASIALVAVGVGAVLAALNVAYRDFRYVIPFLVQLWLFATPSVYMATSTGHSSQIVRIMVALNPLTDLITAFRAAALNAPFPWTMFLIETASALLIFLGGCMYFKRVEDSFADVI